MTVINLRLRLDKMYNTNISFKLLFTLFITAILAALPHYAHAISLGYVVDNISKSFPGIVNLFFSLSVIAGLAFAVAAAFKFKQFKDNPTQITIGQPIGLLMVGAGMLWLPYVIQVVGNTITGTNLPARQQGQATINNSPGRGFGQFLRQN